MKPIVVAGSINMDLEVWLDRLPVSGETVVGKTIQYIPGGKGANQAIAAQRLGGGAVALIGKLGEDVFGDTLLRFLSAQNLRLEGVGRASGPTGTAIINVDSKSENTIVVVPGANFEVGTTDIDAMKGLITEAGVAVAQCEIPIPVVEYFLTTARQNGVVTILNAAPARELTPELLKSIDYLIVNETELALLAYPREVPSNIDLLLTAASKLQAQGPPNVVVTLGAKGSVTLAGSEAICIEGIEVEATDPTGAGDCFVGGLAARLNTGATLREALAFGNRAAALSVQRIGASASIPYAYEIEDLDV